MVLGEKHGTNYLPCTILLGLLRSDPNWLVQSNVEFGDGFADILMEPEVYGCRDHY